MSLRIGLDVGGTHTDAVVLDSSNSVIETAKVQTSRDIITGVSQALATIFSRRTVDPSQVSASMFGTTHCTNAIVERKKLAKVGILRIGKHSSGAIPPLYSLPSDLVQALRPSVIMIQGGHDYNGDEIFPLIEDEVRNAATLFRENNVGAIAVSSVFSPVSRNHEQEAAKILSGYLPSLPISMSSEIGSLGLIPRENAAILNAALVDVANLAIESFEKATVEVGIRNAKLFLTQNDGTLMNTGYARRFPVKTIACGPTNSIRGAAYLSGLTNGIVIDIGGTTALVGAIENGFPRESGVPVSIGGVSTNFRMPDLLAVGCGGGTVVRWSDTGNMSPNERITIGPDSVGYELTERGLCWGGHDLTTTDVAIANGYASINDGKCDPSKVSNLDKTLAQATERKIIKIVEDAVDKMKTKANPSDVVLVGGGGIIIPRSHYSRFRGASKVVRPELFQYANAIGAAIAQTSGEIDRIFSYERSTREEVLDEAKQLCVSDAINAGAIPETVRIVEVDQIPMTYVATNAIRIRAKAIGELNIGTS